MGILNITPDSFYKNSRCIDVNVIKNRIKSIIAPDIIDIGAESTRPNSDPLSEIDELSRLSVIFDNMDLFKDKILSIDTYKPNVAQRALENGFKIINDIRGGEDEKMLALASEFNSKIILMHMRGNPKTMQKNVFYSDIIDDISCYFEERINKARVLGIPESNIIIDPGIGFGKTQSDNYKIINNISKFKSMGFHVMIGLSRKSFLAINNDSPIDRLTGTIAANIISLLNGADIIRVHDVEEHVLLRNIIERFKNNK